VPKIVSHNTDYLLVVTYWIALIFDFTSVGRHTSVLCCDIVIQVFVVVNRRSSLSQTALSRAALGPRTLNGTDTQTIA
jgi:hypothetical protein